MRIEFFRCKWFFNRKNLNFQNFTEAADETRKMSIKNESCISEYLQKNDL